MNDDEVLYAVRQSLSGVRMQVPVDEVVSRGRERRRVRYGLIGGGLATAACVAVALPLTSPGSTAAPETTARSSQAASTGWTLVKNDQGMVELVLQPALFRGPTALESALAEAGIPAVVRAGVMCGVKGEPGWVGDPDDIFVQRNQPDGKVATVIDPKAIPAGSHLVFSLPFAGIDTQLPGPVVALTNVAIDAPLTCVKPTRVPMPAAS